MTVPFDERLALVEAMTGAATRTVDPKSRTKAGVECHDLLRQLNTEMNKDPDLLVYKPRILQCAVRIKTELFKL